MASGSPKDKKDEDSPDKEGEEASGGSKDPIEMIRTFVKNLTFNEKPEKILDENTLDGIVSYIKAGKCKNLITMAGAGISTSAGIPDFRSPGSGLYDNLQKYNLPQPEAIFEIGFFRSNPNPFFTLAKELLPGSFKPTVCHYFIRLLEEKGLLLRHYTQNIDTLERVAGLPEDKLVEAHGTFHTSHCLDCSREYTMDWITEHIKSESIPTCTHCSGIVKPDIVFFGENLPKRFFRLCKVDFQKCDLLIIMGSSLCVQPFALMVDNVPDTTPRLLINREKAGKRNSLLASILGTSGGMDFDSEDNTRDVAWLGDCDEGCQLLADKLGWGDELRKLVRSEHDRIDREKRGKQQSEEKKEEQQPEEKKKKEEEKKLEDPEKRKSDEGVKNTDTDSSRKSK